VGLLSTNHKCTHPYLRCSEENPGVEYFINYEEFWGCDQPVRSPWKMKMESRLHCYRCSSKDFRVYPRECKKVNKSFLYVLSNVLWYYTHDSIICVKLWYWHTYEMHSVFFGKTGVTEWYQSNADCRTHPQIEMVEVKDSLSRKPFQHQNILFILKNIYIILYSLTKSYLLLCSTLSLILVLPPWTTTRVF
jgi:hypothetical protein